MKLGLSGNLARAFIRSPLTPLILMALYEIDLLTEPAALKWHSFEAGPDDPATAVREAAAPFVKWLQTADVENQPEVS